MLRFNICSLLLSAPQSHSEGYCSEEDAIRSWLTLTTDNLSPLAKFRQYTQTQTDTKNGRLSYHLFNTTL